MCAAWVVLHGTPHYTVIACLARGTRAPCKTSTALMLRSPRILFTLLLRMVLEAGLSSCKCYQAGGGIPQTQLSRRKKETGMLAIPRTEVGVRAIHWAVTTVQRNTHKQLLDRVLVF